VIEHHGPVQVLGSGPMGYGLHVSVEGISTLSKDLEVL
jgi:hypothetical protein